MAINLNPEGADQDSGSGLVKSSENTPGRDKRIVAGEPKHFKTTGGRMDETQGLRK